MTPLIDGRVECSHLPEAHVVYEAGHDLYRAMVYCRCRKVSARSGKLHLTQAGAEAAAKDLVRAAMEARA